MSMEVLDPDALSIIFHNLNFIERVKLESVCRLWRYVLQRQSTYSDIHKLNVAEYLSSTNTEYYQQESLSSESTVLGIVERCGAYVHELSFGGRWLKVSQAVVEGMADFCYRLRVLDLGAVIINADISPLLDEIAENLEYFSLEETSWVEDSNARKVASYFPRMKRLKHFNARSSASFMLNELHRIGGKLRFLDASSVHHMSVLPMFTLLRNQTDLEELVMAPAPVFTEEIAGALAELSKLRRLSLSHIPREDIVLDLLGQLFDLVELKFKDVQCLTEMSLHSILSHLPTLDSLSIVHCRNVYGYGSLEHCRVITRLEIGNTTNLVNEDLYTVCEYGRLKMLKVTQCSNVTSPAIVHALQRNQLEELAVNQCTSLTNEVIFAVASTQTKLRHLSIPGCTKITSKALSAISHLKNIENLRSLDVSKNRQFDDMAILSLHNALTLRKQLAAVENDDSPTCSKQSVNPHQETSNEEKLTIYVLETSVSCGVDDTVSDCIHLLY